jgi:hypothetical protein
MAELVKCKTCGKDVSKTAPTCPHCGETFPGLALRCPACQSMNITTGEKGFGLGKAAAGALLLGPVGLLGGIVGKKDIQFVCQACGHRWKPSPNELK